jgi:NAD(P)-dependent dehydrogenase (short-subunit alcohol dehydrogenase family)
MYLHGKSAVVTGGNQGICKGIALRLTEAGASVLITGRRIGTLEQAVGEDHQRGLHRRLRGQHQHGQLQRCKAGNMNRLNEPESEA